MKKYIYIISVLSVSVTACKKDSTDNISKIVTVSYPTINLKGPIADSVMFIPVGGTYTDAGAILIDDITGAQSDIAPASIDLDVNTAGVYYSTYQASNSNGFETVKLRTLVVYDSSITPEDYTGSYAHLNGRVVAVSQLAPRYFYCDDIYGTFSIPIPGYFVDFGTGLYIPSQPIDPSLGVEIHGEGEKTGTAGSYILDFYGLIRDGNERPRTLTQQ